ncbi:MAG: excinuclease ABC subunit UvrC [Methanomicrobiales archaeon]|nr:excinuclease ABC subunit UvrC [Methanomicrobiales archaeon]
MPPVDLRTIPSSPGCYLFRDASGKILYIGKAKQLRHRVASYFQKDSHNQKTDLMVSRIASADVIVTNNEVEALILENNLIKHHQPRYNINLKDAKNFAYIQITGETFPRICVARRPAGGGQFFGPFVSARERDHVLHLVKRLFRLRTCRRLPHRPCLRAFMNSCSAPCTGMVGAEEYLGQVKRAESVLQGHIKPLLAELREEMIRHAERLEFEQAREIRDQISALEHLEIRQHVECPHSLDQDVVAFLVHGDLVNLLVFSVVRGKLADKEEFSFPRQDLFLEEFLVQYYSEREPPKELILPEVVDPAFEEFLSVRKGKQVLVTVPQKGAKMRLLDLVRRNLELAAGNAGLKVEALQQALRLPEPPRSIECFDISHLSGTSVVGSMVRFVNGLPEKSQYRRFRIRTAGMPDDLAAIGEVVRRRYTRLLQEESALPDLIIVDGGKGQLQAAQEELQKLGISIPLVALAKKEEEVYVPGLSLPLPLSRKDRASLYLQEIRDEAHRFAHAYHTLLRQKEVHR